jgi:hypothetical protein
MATKYVDIWAANNGDGTSSSAAGSAGAAGAWNVLPFEGAPAYGSITAGDTIIIRSKSGGTNATYTKGSNAALAFTSFSATGSAPITWVVDDGTVWAGDSGTLTISTYDGSSSVFTFAGFHRFVGTGTGGSQTCIFNDGYTGGASAAFAIKQNNIFTKCKFTHAATSTATTTVYTLTSTWDSTSDNWTRFNQCYFEIKKAGSSTGVMKQGSYPLLVEFTDCIFDVTARSAATAAIFQGVNNYPLYYIIRGGRVTGATSSWSLSIDYTTPSTNPTYIKSFLFDAGSMTTQYAYSGSSYQTLSVYAHEAMLGGNGDFVVDTPMGFGRWRVGNSYPYLTATCIDGSTGTSIQVWPNSSLCTAAKPWTSQPFVIPHTAASASRTITVELLIKDTAAFATPQKDQWWVEGTYVNSSNIAVWFTTYTTGDLATSTASWNTTSFGGSTYLKRKITYTTSDSLLTNSDVHLFIKSNKVSGGTTDYYFICPDIQIA